MNSIHARLKALGIPDDLIATAKVDGKPLAEVDNPPKKSDLWPGYKSKWEMMYAGELDLQKAAGEILEWHYEGITLKLTDPVTIDGKKRPGMRYKADFTVWLPGGRLKLIEIKGFARAKDVQRYKIARDKYRQIEFVMLRLVKRHWVEVKV